MKKIISLQNKFFSWEYDVIVLAFQTAIVSMLYSLIYVFVLPNSIAPICAVIGVFVTSLIHTVTIKDSLHNRFKSGLILAISAGIATFIGSFCSHSFILMSILLLLSVPFVGLTSSAKSNSAAIVLFTVDLIIVGSGVPGDIKNSVLYGFAFIVGGVSLCCIGWLYAKIFKQTSITTDTYHFRLKEVLVNYRSNTSFAIVLTVAVLIANVISYKFSVPQGFWIPMTVLLVLKSEYDFTRSRMSHRLFGTLVGSILAIIVAIIFLSKFVMALLMFPLLFLIVISLARHYGSYTLVLTIMVTVMLNLIEQQGYLIAQHRLIDTLIGVVIVMIALWFIQPLIVKLHGHTSKKT